MTLSWRGFGAERDARLKSLREAREALVRHLEEHAAGQLDGCWPAGVGPRCHELRAEIRRAVQFLETLRAAR